MNFASVLLSEAVGKLITFYAGVFLLARYLGPEQFGDYNLAFVYVSFFFLLANFGMDEVIVRELAKRPGRFGQTVASALLTKGALALSAFVAANLLLFMAGEWFRYSDQVKSLTRIASIGLLLTVFSVFGAVLHYRLKLDRRSLATVASRFLGAGAILVLIAVDAPLTWFVIAGLLLGVPGVLLGIPEAVLLYVFARRNVRDKAVERKSGIDLSIGLTLLREAWPIAACNLLIMTYLRIDQIMLQSMLGRPELVGNYAVAARFAEVLNVVALAFVASIFPFLCKAFEGEREAFERAYRRSFKYMNMVGIPIACASLLLAEPLLAAFDPKYSEAAPVLTILLFAEIFVLLGIINNRLLISSGKQRLDFVFVTGAAFINILLNYLLIKDFGMVGAAIASLAAYATGTLLGFAVRFTRPFSRAMFSSAARPIAASAVMMAALWLIRDAVGLCASVAIGSAVYVAALLLLRCIDKTDMELVKKVLGKL